MHDLDRTYQEDTEGLELDEDAAHAGDHEAEGYGEHEADSYDEGEAYGEGEGPGDAEVFGEDEVTEMAAELLGVSSEQELDHFLGDLLQKAGGILGKALTSSQGRGIGGMLKGIARSVVPALANAYAPGVGGQITSLLGLELEGLSAEDQELEAAKQYVRLGGEAVRHAIAAPDGADPRAVAETAMTRAAQQFAPGLLRGAHAAEAPSQAPGQSGRWVRRGRHIILHGVD